MQAAKEAIRCVIHHITTLDISELAKHRIENIEINLAYCVG